MNEAQQLLADEREQRKNDLLLMRKLDKRLGVKRYEIDNIMIEVNLRIVQYVYQFKAFSLEYLTLQTIQDFKNYYIIMQNKKLDIKKPVFILRDDKNSKVFVNPSVNRLSFDEGGVIYFLKEELVGK